MNELCKCYMLVISIMFSIIILGCSADNLCSNELLSEYSSPNKAYKVVKFDRGCGATTGNSIQMSIIPNEMDAKNEVGNIFIGDIRPGNNIHADSTVMVSWLNDSTVVVKYNPKLRMFKTKSSYGGFRIIYKSIHFKK